MIVKGHPSEAAVSDDTVVQRLREQCYATVLPGIDVGLHDNLFDLGGDSMALIQLVAIAQDVFGVEIDAIEFFTDPTLATLATAIRAESAASAGGA